MSNYKHGLCSHRFYKSWSEMNRRCYDSKSISYHNYGARGITVCEEWRNSPTEYIRYIESLPNSSNKKLSIDRIDNEGNYEHGNLRFVNKHIQQTNQRVRKDNKFGYKGVGRNGNGFNSYIRKNRKHYHLGTFDSIEAAVKVRNDFIVKMGWMEYDIQEYIYP